MSKITQDQKEPKREPGRTGSGSRDQNQQDRRMGDTQGKRTRDGRPICNWCNRPGHIERNCCTKTREEEGKDPSKTRARS